VRTFPTPEAFWRATGADGGFLARLAAVVSDHHFAGMSATGVAFLAALRERTKAALFLATDWPDPEAPAGIRQVSKDPVLWRQLASLA
jgi:hypothetical protein